MAAALTGYHGGRRREMRPSDELGLASTFGRYPLLGLGILNGFLAYLLLDIPAADVARALQLETGSHWPGVFGLSGAVLVLSAFNWLLATRSSMALTWVLRGLTSLVPFCVVPYSLFVKAGWMPSAGLF